MIRVMSQRVEQRDQTRKRIVDAVLELLECESPAIISVPAVAERAGVSLRTVYRYFPTKADLIHSASHTFDDPVTEQLGQQPEEPGADLEAYLGALWGRFAENVAAVRAQHQTPGGREIRAARLAEYRQRVDRATAASASHLRRQDRAELVDLVIALTSSSMFLELVDRQGHQPDKAVAMALRPVRALWREVRAEREETR